MLSNIANIGNFAVVKAVLYKILILYWYQFEQIQEQRMGTLMWKLEQEQSMNPPSVYSRLKALGFFDGKLLDKVVNADGNQRIS